MSQDQQPKQPPEKIEPTLTPKSQKGQLESVLQQIRQALQQTWNQAQPILRSQSIKALQVTIRTLEGLLVKLEAQSPKLTSAKESLDTQSTATVKPSESQVVSEAPPASGVPDHTAPVPPSESVLDRLRPRLEQLQGWWNIALGKIRSWLPESINQKLSDTALTGVVVGTLVILLWTTSSLLPGKPPKVADAPLAQPHLPVTDLTAPPELSVPALPQPVEVSPPALEPVATPSPTAKLDAPEPPQPVEVSPPPSAVATPPPTPELSPEQQLIADIQTQATEAGDQYTDSLVQSVQVDLQGSHLTVRASNDWYNLSPSQQDELANELLNQAQKFNLNKLELIDPKNVLLARSPVVGDNVVILKRQIRSAVVAS